MEPAKSFGIVCVESLLYKESKYPVVGETLLCIHLMSRQAHSDSGSERAPRLSFLHSTGTEESIKRISAQLPETRFDPG